MARKKGSARNASRRLGDRLWSQEGQEYSRVVLAGYFLPGSQLASTLSTRSPRVGLLRDHSPIEWPEFVRLDGLLRRVSADGELTIDGRRFLPTLWTASDGACLVLFEEVH